MIRCLTWLLGLLGCVFPGMVLFAEMSELGDEKREQAMEAIKDFTVGTIEIGGALEIFSDG